MVCTFASRSSTNWSWVYFLSLQLLILSRKKLNDDSTRKRLILRLNGSAFIRSSHRWCSQTKDALRNFTKFTGKHLCQSLFLNKLQAWAICKPRHWNWRWNWNWNWNWYYKRYYIQWTPNLAGWWLRIRGPHPQSQATLGYRGHVTNKRSYISTFTRPMNPKRSRVVT